MMNSAEPTASVGSPTTPGGGSPVERPGGLERSARLRTVIAGLELWLVATVVPWLEQRPTGQLGLLLGALPVVLLGLGELWRRRSPRLARACLLGGVPLSIAAASAAEPSLAAGDAWAGVLGPVVAASLLFFLAVALHSFARPAPTRATGWQPVPEAAWSRPPPGRGLATTVVLALLAASLVATAVLPFAISRVALEARFPNAADDARTLAIAVGGGLFSVALGAIVGPALRARRAHDRGRERIGRALFASLSVAVLAAIGWAWITYAR